MNTLNLNNRRGFTLIELLIVLGILAVVIAAVYSLYSVHQQSAYTQDAVVEVQQNLRIGMDSITRDLKSAGLLIPAIPANTTPVNVVADGTGIQQIFPTGINSDTLSINAYTGAIAKITKGQTGLGAFTVDLPDSVDRFAQNQIVTIIRLLPTIQQSPFSNPLPAALDTYKVNGAPNRVALTIPLGTNSGTIGGAGVQFLPGDLIVATPYPSVLTYCLVSAAVPAPCIGGATNATCPNGQLCLAKVDGAGTTQVIAQNITGLQFSYLVDDGTEAPPAPFPAQLKYIHAVRITLYGQTPPDAQGNIRRRQMDSVVEIRNRNL